MLRITNERCVKTYFAPSMNFLKKYYECIENQNSIQYQAFIKNFRKVVLIMVVLEANLYICDFSQIGHLQFLSNMSFCLIGSKLSEEIMVKRESDPFCQKLNELFFEIRGKQVSTYFLQIAEFKLKCTQTCSKVTKNTKFSHKYFMLAISR